MPGSNGTAARALRRRPLRARHHHRQRVEGARTSGPRTGWMICPTGSAIMDAVILRENSSEIMNILGETIAEIACGPSGSVRRWRRPGRRARRTSRAWTHGCADAADRWTPPARRPDRTCPARRDRRRANSRDRLLAPPYRTFVMPGSAYGLPQHIRLGVGGGLDAKLGLGLDRLSACLSDWPQRRSDG
jgi:aspartate/methionine/tyrosine aminotransferase